MKKALLVVAMVFAITAPALAEEAAEEGPEYNIFTKLFRGIGNIIISPTEIPVTLFNVSADTDVSVGLTFGVMAGAAAGAERAIAGAVDIATFIFPPYDRKLITYEIGKSPAAQAAVSAFPKEL